MAPLVVENAHSIVTDWPPYLARFTTKCCHLPPVVLPMAVLYHTGCTSPETLTVTTSFSAMHCEPPWSLPRSTQLEPGEHGVAEQSPLGRPLAM